MGSRTLTIELKSYQPCSLELRVMIRVVEEGTTVVVRLGPCPIHIVVLETSQICVIHDNDQRIH
jgi:hypothetical protein